MALPFVTSDRIVGWGHAPALRKQNRMAPMQLDEFVSKYIQVKKKTHTIWCGFLVDDIGLEGIKVSLRRAVASSAHPHCIWWVQVQTPS